LMPEGLADPLTRGEIVGLVRFLSEVGKVGPYSVSKARLARRWQVLEPTPSAYGLLLRTSFASATGDDPGLTWTPAYSKVSGALPLDELPRFHVPTFVNNEKRPVGFARFQLDASSAGKVKLLLHSAAGITLWLDGTPVDAKEQ